MIASQTSFAQSYIDRLGTLNINVPDEAYEKLADIQTQLENARTEMEAPFAREAELAEKTRRLQELNVLLNLDAKDKTLMADEPDEGDKVAPRKNEYAR